MQPPLTLCLLASGVDATKDRNAADLLKAESVWSGQAAYLPDRGGQGRTEPVRLQVLSCEGGRVELAFTSIEGAWVLFKGTVEGSSLKVAYHSSKRPAPGSPPPQEGRLRFEASHMKSARADGRLAEGALELRVTWTGSKHPPGFGGINIKLKPVPAPAPEKKSESGQYGPAPHPP